MSKRSDKEYQELGRRLENIYLTGYVNRNEMLKMSFIKGLVTGFGGVIGATIVVAILAWFLSLFDTIPLIGPLVDKVETTVSTHQRQ